LSGPQVATESPLRQTIRFFGSMQFGLVLLLLVAAVSAGATLLDMEQAIARVYSSWWYLTLLTLLSLNLLLCSVQRLGPLYRLAFKTERMLGAADINRLPSSRAVRLLGSTDPVTAASAALKSMGMRVTATEGPSGTVICGERGRLGYFGSWISHVSLLVILFGAVYGVVTGYDVTNGGWVGSQFTVQEGGFSVEITDIRMVQAEDPRIRPRVYSDVTVRRDDKVLANDTVSINYPVRFLGNTIYHSTFLQFPVLRLTDIETGEVGSSRFLAGDRVYLDAKRTLHIRLQDFFPHFSMRADGTPFNIDYRPERPVAIGTLMRNNQPQGPVFLPLNKAQVFDTPDGRVEVMMTGFDLAAVYSISKNLGRPYLFVGSLLLLLGLYLSFFASPLRIYALQQEDGTLMLGGSRYRSKLNLNPTLDLLEERIKQRGDAK